MLKTAVRVAICLVAVLIAAVALGQPMRYHKWEAAFTGTDVRAGEGATVTLKATIEPGWHRYKIGQEGGPQATLIELVEGSDLEVAGAVKAPEPIVKFDKNFNIDVGMYEGSVEMTLPVKVKAGTKPGEYKAKLMVTSQVCDETTCDRPREDEIEITFTVVEGEARPDRIVAAAPAGGSTGGAAPTSDFDANFNKAQSGGVGSFFLFSFLAGLAALLTPCVFPMIPVTVSFFSKQGEDQDRKSAIRAALLYCLGIIVTFTLIGIIVTLAFGAAGVQGLSTNPILNLILFAVFIALAASLFGVFELTLPSSLTSAVNSKSRSAGIVAPLLLGLTFSLTSFTCTVPLVGTILAGAAAGGGLLYPVVGMLGFSTALAIPFFLLALFPQWLKKMPKSGQWMITVKAFMGFLELAAAVKFLSNVDLVYQWEIITKPVFLALWAIIMAICGLYLLGWLRLPHDAGTKIGWGRRVFALASVASAAYCLAGLQGQSLGSMEAFLPPADYGAKGEKKYDGWLTDFEEAKRQAAATGKPIFVDFTGYTCTNCRWMESNMFPVASVKERMDGMIRVKLYTDALRPPDKRAESVKNQELQQKLTNSTTLPVYVITKADGSVVSKEAYTTDQAQYLGFLDKGIAGVKGE